VAAIRGGFDFGTLYFLNLSAILAGTITSPHSMFISTRMTQKLTEKGIENGTTFRN